MVCATSVLVCLFQKLYCFAYKHVSNGYIAHNQLCPSYPTDFPLSKTATQNIVVETHIHPNHLNNSFIARFIFHPAFGSFICLCCCCCCCICTYINTFIRCSSCLFAPFHTYTIFCRIYHSACINLVRSYCIFHHEDTTHTPAFLHSIHLFHAQTLHRRDLFRVVR